MGNLNRESIPKFDIIPLSAEIPFFNTSGKDGNVKRVSIAALLELIEKNDIDPGAVTSVNGDIGVVTVQETLESETNIKSIRGTTLLGAGVITNVPKTVTFATAPTINDDSADGYLNGDEWTDSVTGTRYKLKDNTLGAAVWEEIGGGGTDLGNILYVSTTGSNLETRANALGNLGKPLTWERAAAVAVLGDTVVVVPGTYTLTSTATNGYWVNGVTWDVMYGANVYKSTVNPIWRRTASGTAAAHVYGQGNYYTSGSCGDIYLNELSGIDCIFKFNIADSTSGAIYWSNGANNDDYIIGTHYAKSTANIPFNTYFGKTYISCPTIISTTTHTIRRYIGTSTTIIANHIENTSGGVALDGGVFSSMGSYVTITAAYISYAHIGSSADVTMNVAYMNNLIASCGGVFRVSGGVTNLTVGGGEIFVGGVISLSQAASNAYCSVTTSLINSTGTISILGNDYKSTFNLYQQKFGVDYSNQPKTFIIGGARATVNILGEWAAFAYDWTITNGRVNVLGNYYTSPIDSPAAPFVLSGGTMNIEGTMTIGQSGSKEGMIRKTGGTLILNKGTIIVNNQNQKAIIAPTTTQNIKVYSGGFNTNKTNFFGVEKQKIKATINAQSVPAGIVINGVTFTATPDTIVNMSFDLVTQINASVNVNINGIVTASQDSPGVDAYYYVEADVAGVEFIAVNGGYTGIQFIPYHTAGLIDTVGGTTIIDADIIS